MTHCKPKTFQFSKLNGKQVTASFNGGSISSDGGLLLIREIDKKLQLTKRVSKLFKDQRHQSYIEHTIKDMLKQRIYAICSGYEDLNDHDFLKNDSCFQTAIGKEVMLASSSTLSRFENSITREINIGINKYFVKHFISKHKTPPKELILDFDPTDNRIHGDQEKKHYHGYYEDYCYLPLHVFCGDDLLISYLRPSDIDGAKHSAAILKLLTKMFHQVWPDVKIIFRADAGFARPMIYNWCEKNNVKYITGMPSNKRLEKLSKMLTTKVERQFQKTQEKQKLYCTFQYSAETWKTKRKIVVKAEYNELGSNTRFVVTNMSGGSKDLYENNYCPRGNMENGIKQLKLDLFSDRNSCHNFLPNQFRTLLSSLAYVLMTELKLHTNTTDILKAYCGTVRLRLIKIGTLIIKNSRRIQFMLSNSCPFQDDFKSAVQGLSSA
jgi:hypothetical protein